MTIHLEGLVAVVTGAAGGIGRGICAAMQDAGATVIATDIVDDPGDITASHFIKHDVTSIDEWAKVANYVQATHGRLDALANNAGISIVNSIEGSSLDEWRKVQAINVESILLGTQAMLPLLKEGGKARKSGAAIVNTCSVGGQGGAAFNAAYCSSKGAVNMLSKCAAIEFASLGYNIRVNTIHPGAVDTDMLESIVQKYVDMGVTESVQAGLDGVIASHPLGRAAQPTEIGGSVVYLCSDAASYVTGSSLNIDGGYTAS